MKRFLWITAILLLVGITTALAVKKPNFIIFIADDVSWNDFGCYGNKEVSTPNIDRLARGGLRFDNTYLVASSCSPSRNSIMTGRYPHNCGAAELHTQPPMDMIAFPELMRSNGYYTVQSGKFHMGEYAKRAFDVMQSSPAKTGDGGEELWVENLRNRPKEKPFFIWYAAFDAHRGWGPNRFSGSHNPDSITPPYYLVNEKGTREDLGHYYDEIARFDSYIGKVGEELKRQGVLQETMIIVMADNGRPFPHSKTRVNDRGMKTPFLIHYPKLIKEGGQCCKALVSSIDIAPTILSLSGTTSNDQFQGRSFEGLLKNPNAVFRNYVFAEHNWHDFESFERMVRDTASMYIFNARPNNPQWGPADAVASPSMVDLFSLKEDGHLTAAQSEIFMAPRPCEELYIYSLDSLQWLNVASLPQYQTKLKELSSVLSQWMDETGDDIPEKLTTDWFIRIPGASKKTENYGIRGEMPGAKNKAVKNNQSGPF